MEGLPFGLVTAPRVLTSLIKPILSLCQQKGFTIIIYYIYYFIILLYIIAVMVPSKYTGKRA